MGLEIAGCRHGFAQHAVNMMHGEVYGYAHYMQVHYYLPRNTMFFWYDVVCKYWPWLAKCDQETLQKMKPALSVMHAKAHAWYCQVRIQGVKRYTLCFNCCINLTALSSSN